MRLLLDTHIFLWWIKNDRCLTKATKNKILSATEVYISSASIWEIAIKLKLKKIQGDIHQIINAIDESGFSELPIIAQHAALVCGLEEIHKDPFDRLLIATAMYEPLTFLTADATLKQYSELVEVVPFYGQ